MAEGLGAGVGLHRCTYNQEAERDDECRCWWSFLLGTTPTPSLFSLCQSAASLREGPPRQFSFSHA